jgi:5-methylthioribose kinase
MEDVGPFPTLEHALLDGRLPTDALARLGAYLAGIDAATRPLARELTPQFQNTEMRELHGEHIFTLPFEPNEFGIAPAVQAEAERLLGPAIRERIRELRASYYGEARGLVHADVQGTNVLLTPDGPRLLDAEIAHVGDPGFDLGSLRAHLEVHVALGQGGAKGLTEALLAGHEGSGGDPRVRERSAAYAGVELLRRTLGAARFPFVKGPEQALLVLAHGVGLLAR